MLLKIPNSMLSDPWCRAFGRCSQWVGLTLDQSDQFKIGISEESITDFLLLRLKGQLKDEIVTQKFSRGDESITGADWEWWFVDNSKGFGFRVQAKRLRAGQGTASPRYEELKKAQADQLIQEARNASPPRYPIYCFYNPAGVMHAHYQYNYPYWRLCWWSPLIFPRRLDQLLGCTVADAQFVQKALAGRKKDKKDLNSILPASFPLCCLVCNRLVPRSGPVSGIAKIAAAAAQGLAHVAQQAARLWGLDLPPGPAPEPVSKDNLPWPVRRLISGEPSDEAIEGLQGVVVFNGQE
jgi:hypothetical protein